MSESYRSASRVSLPGQEPQGTIGPVDVAKKLWESLRDLWREILHRVSFWTVVASAATVASVYYFVFAESLYDSAAIVSIQNKSSTSSSMLGGILGSSAGGSQTQQLYEYMTSLDMLKILDSKFHLRELYASAERNPFWRLWSPESDDKFLSFFQSMVQVEPDATNSLISIDVLDYDAQRAHAIASEIVAQAQKFMNGQSAIMQAQTMKFARNELQNAVKAVQAAKLPYERQVAELRLSAAQQALATATGIANQQQMFVLPVSVPSLPTNTTHPQRLLDIAGIVLITALTYAVGFLMWSNVRDHRKT